MITTETHEHALNCDTHNGRYCDCGLTGMSAVHFYKDDGEPVYKEPVLKTPPFMPGNFFGRYNSLEGAARNLAMIGNPLRYVDGDAGKTEELLKEMLKKITR
jgi:hypothetical protein